MSPLRFEILGLRRTIATFVYHRRDKLVLQLLWQIMGDCRNDSTHQKRRQLIDLIDQIAIKEDPQVRDEIRIRL